MSYTITTHHADGTVTSERTETRYPRCPTTTGQTGADRRSDIFDGLKATRSALRDKRGFDRSKSMRMVARVPQEVFNHVLRNEGREAAMDARHLIKRSRELGIDPVVSKGRF